MSRGVNKCFFIGNLGADPKSSVTQSGTQISSFSLAINESWNDKQTGEKKQKTEWINIVAFNKLAEICNQYLRKGSQVYIEGSLRTRKWQGQDGQDRYTTEIVAGGLQMLGGRDGERDGKQTAQPAGKSVPAPEQSDFDDDIPF